MYKMKNDFFLSLKTIKFRKIVIIITFTLLLIRIYSLFNYNQYLISTINNPTRYDQNAITSVAFPSKVFKPWGDKKFPCFVGYFNMPRRKLKGLIYIKGKCAPCILFSLKQ